MNAAIDKMADEIFQAVAGYFKRSVDPLSERIQKLEARIAELEARKSLSYAGIWKHDRGYYEGMMVTDRSCVWIAKMETRARPGEHPESWVLAAKPHHQGGGR